MSSKWNDDAGTESRIDNTMGEPLAKAEKSIFIDLGSVEVETQGGAGGTPDVPAPGRDTGTIVPGM